MSIDHVNMQFSLGSHEIRLLATQEEFIAHFDGWKVAHRSPDYERILKTAVIILKTTNGDLRGVFDLSRVTYITSVETSLPMYIGDSNPISGDLVILHFFTDKHVFVVEMDYEMAQNIIERWGAAKEEVSFDGPNKDKAQHYLDYDLLSIETKNLQNMLAFSIRSIIGIYIAPSSNSPGSLQRLPQASNN